MASCITGMRPYSALSADLSRRRVQHMLFAATASSRRPRSSPSKTISTSSSSPQQPATTAAYAGGASTAAIADPIPDPRNQRVLHAAVAGLPNAGKSTLLNYMVGDKVRGAMLHCQGSRGVHAFPPHIFGGTIPAAVRRYDTSTQQQNEGRSIRVSAPTSSCFFASTAAK